MAKTLKQILSTYKPKAKDEQDFADKHTAQVDEFPVKGGDDDVFTGKNVKPVDRKKERHGYNPGEDEKVYEEVEQVEEKLSPSQGAGEYIKDFKKSSAPQFKGKSQEKRRTMGIAAYLQAKKQANEEVYTQDQETIEEDVDTTLLELYLQLDEQNQDVMIRMIDEGRQEELFKFLEVIEE